MIRGILITNVFDNDIQRIFIQDTLFSDRKVKRYMELEQQNKQRISSNIWNSLNRFKFNS